MPIGRWVVLLLGALGALGEGRAEACTTFLAAREGEVVVGKNYDWDIGEGLVVTNQHGVAKQAIVMRPGDRPARWVSKHASVTFNQYGREMPNGGMNWAGLVVEVMWLDASVFPPSDDRPAVTELQFVQYLLDTSATVAEAIARAREVRVSLVHGKVHYLVCDRGGACAALEFIGGKLVVTTGAAMPVKTLTNHTYAQSVAFLRRHQGFGGREPVPEGRGSLPRFVRASARAAAAGRPVGTDLPTTAGLVLDATAQGEYTKWRIVYAPARRRVYFRSLASPRLKWIELGRLPRGCAHPVRLLDLQADLAGDVTGKLQAYTEAANGRLVRTTLGKLRVKLPPAAVDELVRYPGRLPCLAGKADAPP
jgi:choloylglycine hydrolase